MELKASKREATGISSTCQEQKCPQVVQDAFATLFRQYTSVSKRKGYEEAELISLNTYKTKGSVYCVRANKQDEHPQANAYLVLHRESPGYKLYSKVPRGQLQWLSRWKSGRRWRCYVHAVASRDALSLQHMRCTLLGCGSSSKSDDATRSHETLHAPTVTSVMAHWISSALAKAMQAHDCGLADTQSPFATSEAQH